MTPIKFCKIPLPSALAREARRRLPAEENGSEEYDDFEYDRSINMMAYNFIGMLVSFMDVSHDSSIAQPRLALTTKSKLILQILPDILNQDTDDEAVLFDPDQEEKLAEFFLVLEDCLPRGAHLDADGQYIVFDHKPAFFNLLCNMILHEELDFPQPEDMHMGWPEGVHPEETKEYFAARADLIVESNEKLEQENEFLLHCAPNLPYVSMKSYYINAILSAQTPIDMSMDAIRDVLKTEGVDVRLPEEFSGKAIMNFSFN